LFNGVDWFDIDDIAIDSKGTMYGTANAEGFNDRFVIINKETGTVTDLVPVMIDGEPLNDIEGLTYYGNSVFFGTTGVESTAQNGDESNSLFRIDLKPFQAEKIISLDQDFNGYIPYDYESLACRMCLPKRK